MPAKQLCFNLVTITLLLTIGVWIAPITPVGNGLMVFAVALLLLTLAERYQSLRLRKAVPLSQDA